METGAAGLAQLLVWLLLLAPPAADRPPPDLSLVAARLPASCPAYLALDLDALRALLASGGEFLAAAGDFPGSPEPPAAQIGRRLGLEPALVARLAGKISAAHVLLLPSLVFHYSTGRWVRVVSGQGVVASGTTSTLGIRPQFILALQGLNGEEALLLAERLALLAGGRVAPPGEQATPPEEGKNIRKAVRQSWLGQDYFPSLGGDRGWCFAVSSEVLYATNNTLALRALLAGTLGAGSARLPADFAAPASATGGRLAVRLHACAPALLALFTAEEFQPWRRVLPLDQALDLAAAGEIRAALDAEGLRASLALAPQALLHQALAGGGGAGELLAFAPGDSWWGLSWRGGEGSVLYAGWRERWAAWPRGGEADRQELEGWLRGWSGLEPEELAANVAGAALWQGRPHGSRTLLLQARDAARGGEAVARLRRRLADGLAAPASPLPEGCFSGPLLAGNRPPILGWAGGILAATEGGAEVLPPVLKAAGAPLAERFGIPAAAVLAGFLDFGPWGPATARPAPAAAAPPPAAALPSAALAGWARAGEGRVEVVVRGEMPRVLGVLLRLWTAGDLFSPGRGQSDYIRR